MLFSWGAAGVLTCLSSGPQRGVWSGGEAERVEGERGSGWGREGCCPSLPAWNKQFTLMLCWCVFGFVLSSFWGHFRLTSQIWVSLSGVHSEVSPIVVTLSASRFCFLLRVCPSLCHLRSWASGDPFWPPPRVSSLAFLSLVLSWICHPVGPAHAACYLLPGEDPLRVLVFGVLLNASLLWFLGDVFHIQAPPGASHHHWDHLRVSLCVLRYVFLFHFCRVASSQDLSRVLVWRVVFCDWQK